MENDHTKSFKYTNINKSVYADNVMISKCQEFGQVKRDTHLINKHHTYIVLFLNIISSFSFQSVIIVMICFLSIFHM